MRISLPFSNQCYTALKVRRKPCSHYKGSSTAWNPKAIHSRQLTTEYPIQRQTVHQQLHYPYTDARSQQKPISQAFLLQNCRHQCDEERIIPLFEFELIKLTRTQHTLHDVLHVVYNAWGLSAYEHPSCGVCLDGHSPHRCPHPWKNNCTASPSQTASHPRYHY